MENVLVSVCVTTYFHEKYIAQAIDSILKQNVNFKYEIVISDDASSDETVNILTEYAKKYDFIKLNLNSHNVGLTMNAYKAYSMCSGKYIVCLSGDDYYIDQDKLQKQFDFLEKNNDFFGVCTFIEQRYDNELKRVRLFPSRKLKNKQIVLKDFLNGVNYPLNGIMVKNVWLTEEGKKQMEILPNASAFIDDITLSIEYLLRGKIYIIKDVCTVYRTVKNVNGKHNFNSINKGLASFKKHIENLNNLSEFYGDKVDLYKRYKIVVSWGFLKALLLRQIREFNAIYNTIPQCYKKRKLKFFSIINAFFQAPLMLIKKLYIKGCCK